MALAETSERAFQSAVLDLARTFGWRVAHHHDSRRQIRPGVFVGDKDAAGYPDLTMVRRDRVLFAELKREKGRMSTAQHEWCDALGEAGMDVYVWRPRDWGEIEQVLR